MRYAKQLETLSLVSEIIATHTGQHEMLLDILVLIEKQLGLMRGTILLLSPDSKVLTIEAVHNSIATIDPDIQYNWGEGIVGTVVSTGQVSIIPCIKQEPLFRDRIHRRKELINEDVSFICVPIKIGNEVVGTLSVDIPCSMDVDLNEEAKVLTVVSSMIANDVHSRLNLRKEKEALLEENLRLRDALGENFRPENIIGNSNSMRDVYLKVHQVSATDTTVLILGESGTGKELIASAIHYSSPRAKNKFIKVNCAALNENLLESELFGHERGSFTGASNTRIGRIEEAESGTIFLDEFGEISLTLQIKLLRFLQEREFERVGSNRTFQSNVRIITATNRNLEQAVAEGNFRNDLYYRVNVFPIFLPPLRERKEDILSLANHFVEKFSNKIKKDVRRISTPAIGMLMDYHWPGNIRELENCIEHAVVVCGEGVIHGYDLPATLQLPNAKEIRSSGRLKNRIEALEHDMIIDALKHTHGNITNASNILGLTSRMIRYKIDKLKIDYTLYFDQKNKTI
jgi:Nif-specific regulatory protein